MLAWTVATPLVAEQLVLGERIFQLGQGRDSREITAQVGASGLRLSGRAIACAGCHGEQGAGGGEGWIVAPDIRWFNLTKFYGERRIGGKPRPPYNATRLKQAIRQGMASDEVPLDPAMPRFDLADDEIDALIDYLQALSNITTAAQPSLFMILPADDAGFAGQVAAAVQKCPASRHPVRVFEYGTPDDALTTIASMAENGEILALFASYVPGWEDRYVKRTQELGLPTLMPMYIVEPDILSGQLFHLPGVQAQVLALLRTAKNRSNRLSVWFDEQEPLSVKLLHFVDDYARRLDLEVSASPSFKEAFSLENASTLVLNRGRFIPGTASRSVQILIPSVFVDPVQADNWVNAFSWEVIAAFPYQPNYQSHEKWIDLTRAWHAIGCTILESLPPVSTDADKFDEWRQLVGRLAPLNFPDWLVIPPRSTLEQDGERVVLLSWK